MSQSEGQEFKVALYARVSTEEQRQGQTIESQIAELERFAGSKGWTIAGTYKDDGWSGAILARPSLDRLRDDCACGLFSAVVVNDVDRMARDVSHLGIIKRDLERKSVQLIFRKLPGDSSPTHNLMVNILGSFAEFEREQIIDRTRRGRRHKIEVRKEYVGCNAPYGYHYRAGSGLKGAAADLSTVPEQARVVRQMFDWVLEGLSMQKIADRLDEAGVPTPKGGKKWNICSICRMLHNETYAGVWSYGKAEPCEPGFRRSYALYRRKTKTSRRRKPKSEWLQVQLPESLVIVPRSQWVRVQERIAHNEKFSPRNTKYQYLLQGLMRCTYCHWLVTTHNCWGSGRSYLYYHCWRRDCRDSRWCPRDTLEQLVWQRVRDVLLSPANFMERARKAADRLKFRVQPTDEQRTVSEELKKAHRAEDAVLAEYRAGKLPPVRLAAELDRIRANTAALKERVSNGLTRPLEHIRPSDEEVCKRILTSMAGASFELRRDILRRLIVSGTLAREEARFVVRLPVDEMSAKDSAGPSRSDLPPSRGYKTNRRIIDLPITIRLPRRIRRRGTELSG